MNQNITHSNPSEEQLGQGPNKEAASRLAGGVAHDFNNTLSIIIGYSDLLQMNLPAGDPSHRHAVEIAKAARRAAALSYQLLAISRKQATQPVILDLNAVTVEFEKMLRRVIGEDIEITFKRIPGLGRVWMDPGQVEQVLMNLAVNARDAMPQGGRLLIETANVELDETWARQSLSVPPGSYVMLSVSDTGRGIDKETQLHIFEPFCSTRESGKSMELGLSRVDRIVKQNAGFVLVYSELGKGTTFRVYLPRLADALKLSVPQEAHETMPGGGETVLVVEDDESLRILTRTCLETNNYFVLDAPDAAVALALAKNCHGRIHLLLTGMVMPGLDARELASRLLAFQPEAKMLYMSGYTSDLVDQHDSLDRASLLEKPFTLHSLLTQVYNSLHTASSGMGTAAKLGPASEAAASWDCEPRADRKQKSGRRAAR
jgi:nitrogen-specific signal transduction histidine kinase